MARHVVQPGRRGDHRRPQGGSHRASLLRRLPVQHVRGRLCPAADPEDGKARHRKVRLHRRFRREPHSRERFHGRSAGRPRPRDRRGGDLPRPVGSRGASPGTGGEIQRRRPRQQEPPDAAGVRGPSRRFRESQHGAPPWGNGDGQGTGGADDPFPEPPQEGTLRRGELRGPARHAPGVGAFRLQGRGVHRGEQGQAGPLRLGRRRDPVPR